MEKLWVFVGTSTGGASKGIYRFRFDPSTGECGAVELAAEAVNPGFLAIPPGGRFLYAETGANGTVDEFSVASDGTLVPLGSVADLPTGIEGIAAT